MPALLDDLRFALRTLKKHPGFALAVVFTLGAGVAAATLVFAIVNAVLYARYDVYREPARLVAVWEQNARTGVVGPCSVRNVEDWRASARAFERVGTYEPELSTITGGGEPEAVPGGAVSEELLALLDARPAAGRLFQAGDRSSGAPRAALLSHALWQRRFSAAPDIVGRLVVLNGRPVTVVGVLAKTFALAPFAGIEPDVLVPARDPLVADRAARTAVVVGRLRPGATTAQAKAELAAAAARLEGLDPANRGWGVLALNPMEFDFDGDAQFLIVLGVGVVFVLLIVCANVANLLLVRAASRTREIATRLALGASRFRIARHFLVEALTLGAAGGLTGLFLAYWACRGVTWWISGTAIGYLHLAVDARVLTCSVVVALGCSLAVALPSALHLSRPALLNGLKDSFGPGGTRFSGGRVRRLLVSVEVALAVVLLIAAGLVLQGVANLRRVDAGFDPKGVVSQRVVLPDGRYPDAAARARFAQTLVARLHGHPGLAAVAISSHLPGVGAETTVLPFTPERSTAPGGRPPSAWIISAGAGYFEALGVRMLAGRAFAPSDESSSRMVAVVSEGLVKRWLGPGSSVGSRLLVDGQWRTIVGVAADVRNFHLNVAPAPAIYLPFGQRPATTMVLVVRAAAGDGAAFAPAVRAAIREIDGDLALRHARSLSAAMEESLGGFDLTRLLIAGLAAAAVVLAAIGLYAVIAYSVARRTREFGVRMALGAGPARLTRDVVLEGIRLAAWGGLPGLALAALVGRLLAAKLHGVSAADPVLFGSVCALAVTMAAAASWVPARWAARADPAVATRAE